MKIGKIEIKQKDGKFLGVYLGKERVDEIIFVDITALYNPNKTVCQMRVHVDPNKFDNWKKEKSQLEQECEANGFLFLVQSHSPRLRIPKRPDFVVKGQNKKASDDNNKRSRPRQNRKPTGKKRN